MGGILPLTTADIGRSARSRVASSSSSSGRRGSATVGGGIRIPRILRRIWRPRTLDFEVAAWEVVQLVMSPRQVQNSLWYRKQTKNQWARDDPSFVLLQCAMLAVSAIAWGLSYSRGFFSILKLIIYMVGVDFLLVGVAIATVGWLFAERVLKRRGMNTADSGFGAHGEMEWAYCFDVHCNGFLYIWLLLYVAQFVMLLIFRPGGLMGTLIGNTLYFGAFSMYFYATFMGYATMPFLEHTELLLAPIGVFAVIYLGSLLFGFSMVQAMLRLYFGS